MVELSRPTREELLVDCMFRLCYESEIGEQESGRGPFDPTSDMITGSWNRKSWATRRQELRRSDYQKEEILEIDDDVCDL